MVDSMYPSNSKKSKAAKEPASEEREKLQPIVSTAVIQRKKPLGKRIAETFTGDDAKSVANYVFFEVMLPSVKTMISDAAREGIERMLFGESKVRSRSGTSRPGTHTSYNRMYKGDGSPVGQQRKMTQRGLATHDFEEIVIPDRGEAERVLDMLDALIEKYDVATVADLYDLVQITGSFQDSKFGWTQLGGSRISRVREGYVLDLPAPQSLD